jgi:hypothetical protein
MESKEDALVRPLSGPEYAEGKGKHGLMAVTFEVSGDRRRK